MKQTVCVCVCLVFKERNKDKRDRERRGEKREKYQGLSTPVDGAFLPSATRQDQRKGTIIKRKARASLLFPLSPAPFTLRAEKNQGSGPNRGFAIRF